MIGAMELYERRLAARQPVLREFWPCDVVCAECTGGCTRGGREPNPNAMADAILELRAQLARVRLLDEWRVVDSDGTEVTASWHRETDVSQAHAHATAHDRWCAPHAPHRVLRVALVDWEEA
jgi:hypothetical protein